MAFILLPESKVGKNVLIRKSHLPLLLMDHQVKADLSEQCFLVALNLRTSHLATWGCIRIWGYLAAGLLVNFGLRYTVTAIMSAHPNSEYFPCVLGTTVQCCLESKW